MKKKFLAFLLVIIAALLSACYQPHQGREAIQDPLSNTSRYVLPLIVTETNDYQLSLIDVYISEEQVEEEWEEPRSELFYVFKFKLINKHNSSNIRVALVNASVNGYSFKGRYGTSDTSFSIYTWSGNSSDNTAVDTFKLSFEDIEATTNIRNAENMGSANLSFTFRVYIIDEMDDYGPDQYFTIENAFRYCS